MRPGVVAALVVPAALLAGCAGSAAPNAGIVSPLPVRLASHHGIHRIKHVVVIMQENRSFDSLLRHVPRRGGAARRTGTGTSPPACPTRAPARCDHPYHNPSQVNAGGAAQRRLGRALTSTTAGWTGSSRTAEQPGGRGCGDTAPICASSAPPDVMGYHDAREIPNYWRWAHDFTLQDHMFEPDRLVEPARRTSSWSPAGRRAARAAAIPMSCVNDDELGGFKTAQITGKPGADGPATNAAAALRAVTRCLERHGIRRQPYGLDLREPRLPDALALCRHLAPPAEAKRLTEYGNYAWTDLTWLMHMHHVSWRYYIHKGTAPENIPSTTAEIWDPLPSFTDVRRDGQTGNVHGRLPLPGRRAWRASPRRLLGRT